jgi:hypothetical protein
MAKENFGHRSRRTDKIKPCKKGAIHATKQKKIVDWKRKDYILILHT